MTYFSSLDSSSFSFFDRLYTAFLREKTSAKAFMIPSLKGIGVIFKTEFIKAYLVLLDNLSLRNSD